MPSANLWKRSRPPSRRWGRAREEGGKSPPSWARTRQPTASMISTTRRVAGSMMTISSRCWWCFERPRTPSRSGRPSPPCRAEDWFCPSSARFARLLACRSEPHHSDFAVEGRRPAGRGLRRLRRSSRSFVALKPRRPFTFCGQLERPVIMFGSVAQRYLKPFARLRDSWPNRRDPDPSLEALRAGSWKSSECSELDEIVSMIGPDERRGRVPGRFGALHGARIATEPAGDGGRETRRYSLSHAPLI